MSKVPEHTTSAFPASVQSVTFSRRQAGSLAILGALAAVALPRTARAQSAFDADPIFAAIQRHRTAYLTKLRRLRPYSNDPDFGPEYDRERHQRLRDAFESSDEEAYDAALALAEIQPTTMAGVLAL